MVVAWISSLTSKRFPTGRSPTCATGGFRATDGTSTSTEAPALLISWAASLRSSRASWGRGDLDCSLAPSTLPIPSTCSKRAPSLTFSTLAFAYPRSPILGGAGPRVFEGFNWSAPTGATVILGPNGAGKTTLLSLGATVLRPTAGTVRVDGRDTTRRGDVVAIRRAV